VAQCAGAFAGAALLLFIASGTTGFELAAIGLGQNGWGAGYLGEYTTASAFVFELLATFIFTLVILGATHAAAPASVSGLAIGLTLTVIHIVGIPITGVSVNPARSLGPALLVGGEALGQLWLFIVAPLLGAGAAGLLHRQKLLEP
jgi:aquaporin Z